MLWYLLVSNLLFLNDFFYHDNEIFSFQLIVLLIFYVTFFIEGFPPQAFSTWKPMSTTGLEGFDTSFFSAEDDPTVTCLTTYLLSTLTGEQQWLVSILTECEVKKGHWRPSLTQRNESQVVGCYAWRPIKILGKCAPSSVFPLDKQS